MSFDAMESDLKNRWICMAAMGHPKFWEPSWLRGTRGYFALDAKTIEAET